MDINMINDEIRMLKKKINLNENLHFYLTNTRDAELLSINRVIELLKLKYINDKDKYNFIEKIENIEHILIKVLNGINNEEDNINSLIKSNSF
jgi:hypothetical protein